jgi:prepilin-type N-terminal cleavage/methylation domain-containing protein
MMNYLKGFTLVELLVTLVVSAIMISATLAGFTYFSKQYKILSQRIEMDQNALQVIDLIQSDINQAGYKAYVDGNPDISASDVVQELRESPSGEPLGGVNTITLVYDDYKDDGTLYRALVRYYTEEYRKGDRAESIQTLSRDIRECLTPSSGCKVNPDGTFPDSKSLYSGVMTGRYGEGEPILDNVRSIEFKGLNKKSIGTTYIGVYQAVEISFSLGAPRAVEGEDFAKTKTYNFITRLKNVSIVN